MENPLFILFMYQFLIIYLLYIILFYNCLSYSTTRIIFRHYKFILNYKQITFQRRKFRDHKINKIDKAYNLKIKFWDQVFSAIFIIKINIIKMSWLSVSNLSRSPSPRIFVNIKIHSNTYQILSYNQIRTIFMYLFLFALHV